MIIESFRTPENNNHEFISISFYCQSDDSYEKWKLIEKYNSLFLVPEQLMHLKQIKQMKNPLGIITRQVYDDAPDYVIRIITDTKIEICSKNEALVKICFKHIMNNEDISELIFKEKYPELLV